MQNWTKEQLQAINDKDCNILVAAAAGSGKTAVLVERIIKKITQDNIDIDRLLVVTFTNAAASEMRERVYLGINKRLDYDVKSKNILRQMTLLEKASITTIHSFCLEVIRNNLCAIDIDPSFRIADETETVLIKDEVLNELLEQEYELQNLQLLNLLEYYGGNKDDKVIQNMILDVYHFIQSDPWPDRWMDTMLDMMNLADCKDFSCTIWGKVILESVHQEISGLCDYILRAMEIIDTDDTLKDKYYALYNNEYIQMQSIVNMLEGTDNAYKWDKLYNMLDDLEFKRLPAINKSLEVDLDKKDRVKELRDNVKDALKKIREKKIVSTSCEIAKDICLVYPSMTYLVDLVKKFSNLYEQKKRKKNILDFSDLEHYCLKILTKVDANGNVEPSDVARMYKERFVEILVDEYQDSNDIQEKIISTISREDMGTPNVFMVGDVKQSIYRFRQANPSLFLEKYNSYSKESDSKYRKIQLFKNFRSRKCVINVANFIFQQVMSQYVGDLDYTEEEALNFSANFPEYKDSCLGDDTELYLVDVKEEVDSDYDEESITSIQCEAKIVANRILELTSEGNNYKIYDKHLNKYRRIEYKDIVILLRTTKNWAEVFVNELQDVGVHAFADINTGFFKTIEVLVVMSFLQIIDNPLQDIPLLSVLRSPIVGLNATELAQIRVVDKEIFMFEAIEKFLDESDDKTCMLRQKLEKFMQLYEELKQMAWYMSIDELIWSLYDKTGYYIMVGTMRTGEQKQANLRLLFEKARQFEETSYKGLFNFVNFVNKLRNSSSDLGSAKILGENDNVVRIMSIHKSKGLEFPVVFLSGCGKKVNLMDTTKSIIFHSKLGFGPDVVDCKRRISWPSALKIAIGEKIKQETLSEEMRILYVAVTRAREKLIITGNMRDLNKHLERWKNISDAQEDKISAYEVYKGRTFLDWICPVMLKHKKSNVFFEDVPIGFEFPVRNIYDESKWKVFHVDKNEILGEIKKGEEENDLFQQKLDNIEISDDITYIPTKIQYNLQWEYPYKEWNHIPSKISVTDIKKGFNNYSELSVNKPKFIEESSKIDAPRRGTILHFIMQHIDFNNDNIKGQVDVMINKGLLTREEALSVDIYKIKNFMQCDLGQRIKASIRVSREEPFFIKMNCSKLYDLRDCEDEYGEVILQGIIDCYFEEEDYLVLLDYKSDFVKSEDDVNNIKEKYRVQIMQYKDVLEKLTNKRVKYQYIYLFSNEQILKY